MIILIFHEINFFFFFFFVSIDDDRSKERLIQVLEDRELGFLYPMLKIETVLFEKISNNINPDELREWIGQNLSKELTNSVDFIQSIVTW